MIKRIFGLFGLCLFGFVSGQQSSADVTLDYYLPQSANYDPSVPKPEHIIGHEVGEWHITHDKLVQYMTALANASDRMQLTTRGTTYEGRPIILLTVSSPENLARIDEIKANQQRIASGEKAPSTEDPVVIYQGFSIHGNEPSGSNASLAYAYYLAAADEALQLLENTIVLFDPSFNPDGLQRFAYWANTNRAHVINSDPNDREYSEVWPGGRTNHYYFDLNRDWLPVQLPESRARIETFHDWVPNILTDHHEMGTNSTFFFQPGEPKRVHPLTPKINQELTAAIGDYHEAALNEIGSLYYSEENYDDYYYGKGSTFPDVNGSVGILFEQASSRGHVQESENGLLTFPFTVRNQMSTAVSTLKAANGLKSQLQNYQYSYYKQLKSEAQGEKVSGYLFGSAKDYSSPWHLAEVLKRHRIKHQVLDEAVTVSGKKYEAGQSYFVPLNQKNPRLIHAIFEERSVFADSLFYDISAWTFPHAFGVNYEKLSKVPTSALSEAASLTLRSGEVSAKSTYAYLYEPHDYYASKLTHHLTQKGIRVKVAMAPFELEGKRYDYGTLMVPLQSQALNSEELFKEISELVTSIPVKVTAVGTGRTKGIDLGSNDFEPVNPISVALIVGDGISSYDAGEMWHLFDQRFQIKVTKLDTKNLERADLSRYNRIIFPSTSYGLNLSDRSVDNLKQWVRKGGILIGYRNTVNWLKRNEFLKFETRSATVKEASGLRFDQRDEYQGAQVTGGAIFEATIDRSHPINFGFSESSIALFRNTNIYIEPKKQSYENPIRYSNNPLLSGYISEENLKVLSGSVPFVTESLGAGRVIGFTDNTNFRAFWYGTNRLLLNALFFGEAM
ncbi:MAG: M14 family zinc carboxypeptidase [Flavobacteriaceae bacterium]